MSSGKSHDEKWQTMFQLSSESDFSMLKIPFRSGRTFTEAEVDGKRKLAVINETFAQRYMKGENPIGQRIHIVGIETYPDPVKDAWFEVIGVVADAKNQGLQDPPLPEAWVPYTDDGFGEPRDFGANGAGSDGDAEVGGAGGVGDRSRRRADVYWVA